MIKRLKNLILKDITISKRDNVLLYMVIAPVLIAIMMGIFIPSFESSSVIFAVKSDGKGFIDSLRDYGEVIEYNNRQSLEDRITERDDVIGILYDGSDYRVILEGNEKGDLLELAYAVIYDIQNESRQADFTYTLLGRGRSLIKEYTAILLILMSIMVAGMVAGFNIIFEKESGAIKALTITPIRMVHYLTARGIIIIVLSLFISIITSIILLGFRIDYPRLVLGVIFSSGIGIILGFMIGGVADNQIKGIAIVKALALPYTLIPVASIFIPNRFRYFLYPFPNYWMFRIFTNVFIGDNNRFDFWLSNIVTVFITAILILVMIFAFRERLRFG